MDKFFTALGSIVFYMGLVVIFSVIFAYPTKWMVNYLFSPVTLTWVFGVSKISVWQGLWLNTLCASLFKSSKGGK